jgi:hypothetical protein
MRTFVVASLAAIAVTGAALAAVLPSSTQVSKAEKILVPLNFAARAYLLQGNLELSGWKYEEHPSLALQRAEARAMLEKFRSGE